MAWSAGLASVLKLIETAGTAVFLALGARISMEVTEAIIAFAAGKQLQAHAAEKPKELKFCTFGFLRDEICCNSEALKI
jgi:hypothetical protein